MRLLANSPSAGVYEVLRALRRARAYPGRHVRPALLKLYLPFRVPLADIVTVLDAQTGTNVHNDGTGKYALTADGAVLTRSHQPRHFPIWTA